MSNLAKYVNDKLGVKIYVETDGELRLRNWTQAAVKSFFIDDLIDKRGLRTPRLVELTKELTYEYYKEI